MQCSFSMVTISLAFLGFLFPGVAISENISARLEQFDSEFERMRWMQQSADWNYGINVSEPTACARKYASEMYSDWMREWKLWAREIHSRYLSPHQQQIVGMIASGVVSMNGDDTRLISELKAKLTEIYTSAVVTLPSYNVKVQGENEVMSLVSRIRNPYVLKRIWKAWRKQTGKKVKLLYLKLIQLTNKAAKENGYADVGEVWQDELGLDVKTTVLTLWEEVKDLYTELHAYARFKLTSVFGDKYFRDSNLIPAHLLGSLWGENWSAFSDVLMPFPEKKLVNLTNWLTAEGYTVNGILRKAEQFYTSMGFGSLKKSFWKKSMFVKPTDGRTVDCHSVSYDLALKEDFRVRMCGEVKEQTFMEAVHEMGHVYYYKAYHQLPMIFRGGANSAFHEAVGESMVYTAQGSKCLCTLLQFPPSEASSELLLNTLMKQALSKFVLLPWALTVELWRYEVFSGQVTESEMMTRWWELRKKFQGVEPPDHQSSRLFDPLSKYHVVLHIPYMRYFLGRFLEHHFLEALCKTAGSDVHDCCFVSSKEAGEKLWSMLSLGSSVPWNEALYVLTGEKNISSKPLMNYYKPLYNWLVDYNRNHNITTTTKW